MRLDVSSTAAVMGGPQGGGRPVVPGIQRFVAVMGNVSNHFLHAAACLLLVLHTRIPSTSPLTWARASSAISQRARRRERDPSVLKNLLALAFAPHKNAHLMSSPRTRPALCSMSNRIARTSTHVLEVASLPSLRDPPIRSSAQGPPPVSSTG